MEPTRAMPQSSAACATGVIDDLEDLVPVDGGDVLLRPPKQAVVPKRARRRPSASRDVYSTVEGSVPGTQTVHVKTWGCSHNNSDGDSNSGGGSNVPGLALDLLMRKLKTGKKGCGVGR